MLYIIPTPIGNLEDITYRAVKILQSVDYILAEDTRKTQILLRHYDIDTRTVSYHQHNEHRKVSSVISHLKEGFRIAIVSDAGTPGISDPGFLLVRACVQENIPITSLPGASALTTALVASGAPSDRFYFGGFLPHKKGRKGKWEDLASREETIVLYESPYRIKRLVREGITHMGGYRKLCIAREVSKIHEEYLRGTFEELNQLLEDRKELRGELTVIIHPSENDTQK